MRYTADLLQKKPFVFPESPRWFRDAFYFCDIDAGTLYRIGSDGTAQAIYVHGSPMSGWVRLDDGSLLVVAGLERRMAEVINRIEVLRETALEEFFKSDAPTKENTLETSEKAGEKRRLRKKTRGKDPRYLAIALECDKQCAAILGLGEKAAVDRVDEMLGKKRPKLLVVRDRVQASQLVDVSKLLELEFSQPETPHEDTGDGQTLSSESGQAGSESGQPIGLDTPEGQ